jgi:hypothetical protein
MRKTLIAAAATAAALTLSIAGPASAERYGIDDPIESNHGVDLVAVTAINAENSVRVVLTHQNLRRSPTPAAGGAIYFDTDPADRGPEYVFTAGLFAGTDYRMLTTDGFGLNQWGDPVADGLSYSLKLDYANEKSVFKISQEALGNPDRVRVAVRVSGDRAGGGHVVDWMGQPRSFSLWLDRG